MHPEDDASHVTRLLERLRLKWLLRHLPHRLVWATYVSFIGFLTVAILALLSVVTNSPFVFPSLGPTAYLFFFTPLSNASSLGNTILGHGIGLVCGFAAFFLCISPHIPMLGASQSNGLAFWQQHFRSQQWEG